MAHNSNMQYLGGTDIDAKKQFNSTKKLLLDKYKLEREYQRELLED